MINQNNKKEELLIDKLIFLSIEDEIDSSDSLNKLINEFSKDELNMIVPVTSMSNSEYMSLNLETQPKYVLCANGGVLLKDGVVDKEWQQESLKLSEKCQHEFEISKKIFKANKSIVSKVEFVDDIFLKAKCSDKEEVITTLLGTLYHSDVYIWDIEKDIYVLPKSLDKGKNVERFVSYLKEKENYYYIDSTYGIGVSFLDLRMLESVNYVVVSKKLNSNNFTFLNSRNYSFERHNEDGDFWDWAKKAVYRANSLK